MMLQRLSSAGWRRCGARTAIALSIALSSAACSGAGPEVSVIRSEALPVLSDWTTEDQTRLLAARETLRQCPAPMIAEECLALLRATTELGALREQVRTSAAIVSR